MNPVIHFEMPAENKERVVKFYQDAFGWHMQILGPEMNHYILAVTTDSDENGTPKKPGTINGGFFEKTNDKPDQYPSVVIQVPDIKAHMEKIKQAGGEILGEPMEIPGVGWYVSFHDSEGNRAGIMQLGK